MRHLGEVAGYGKSIKFPAEVQLRMGGTALAAKLRESVGTRAWRRASPSDSGCPHLGLLSVSEPARAPDKDPPAFGGAGVQEA